jgi:hypothetical protein
MKDGERVTAKKEFKKDLVRILESRRGDVLFDYPGGEVELVRNS